MIDGKFDGSGNRLKEFRKFMGLTQIDFAKIINASNGHVSDMEKDRKNITPATIELLKLKCGLNENWLRSGSGEMRIIVPGKDEIASLVYNLLDPGDNTLYNFILDIMRVYDKLSPNSKLVVNKAIDQLIELSKGKGEG